MRHPHGFRGREASCLWLLPKRDGGGTTRFDLASALALNPVSPRPTEGLLSLPPLAEDTLTRSRAGL